MHGYSYIIFFLHFLIHTVYYVCFVQPKHVVDTGFAIKIVACRRTKFL